MEKYLNVLIVICGAGGPRLGFRQGEEILPFPSTPWRPKPALKAPGSYYPEGKGAEAFTPSDAEDNFAFRATALVHIVICLKLT
jgi:hypothetical protein